MEKILIENKIVSRYAYVSKDTAWRFENNPHKSSLECGVGIVESMQARIDLLEACISHLMGFIAEKMELSEIEILSVDGITDF